MESQLSQRLQGCYWRVAHSTLSNVDCHLQQLFDRTLQNASYCFRSSLSRAPCPPCEVAGILVRLLPLPPNASLVRFPLPQSGSLTAPATANDVGPDRGVSQSSQRRRCSCVPAYVHTEHVHVLDAAGRVLLLLGSLQASACVCILPQHDRMPSLVRVRGLTTCRYNNAAAQIPTLSPPGC